MFYFKKRVSSFDEKNVQQIFIVPHTFSSFLLKRKPAKFVLAGFHNNFIVLQSVK